MILEYFVKISKLFSGYFKLLIFLYKIINYNIFKSKITDTKFCFIYKFRIYYYDLHEQSQKSTERTMLYLNSSVKLLYMYIKLSPYFESLNLAISFFNLLIKKCIDSINYVIIKLL